MDLGQNVFKTVDTEFEDSQSAICASLEQLQLFADGAYEDHSLESLGTILQGISTAHSSFVSKLQTLFISGKRRYVTEYDTWQKKNGRLIAKVEKMSYEDASQHDIDLPTGMTATYPECMQLISALLKKHDMFVVLSDASKVIDSIQASISQGSNDCERKLGSSNSKMQSIADPLTELHGKLLAAFSVEILSMDQMPFKKHFANMDELAGFRAQLAAANKNIANLSKIQPQLSTLEKGVDQCVTYLLDTENHGEDDYTPSPKFIKQFAHYLSLVDSVVSMYGDTTMRILAITHNTTYLYKTLGGK